MNMKGGFVGFGVSSLLVSNFGCGSSEITMDSEQNRILD